MIYVSEENIAVDHLDEPPPIEITFQLLFEDQLVSFRFAVIGALTGIHDAILPIEKSQAALTAVREIEDQGGIGGDIDIHGNEAKEFT